MTATRSCPRSAALASLLMLALLAGCATLAPNPAPRLAQRAAAAAVGGNHANAANLYRQAAQTAAEPQRSRYYLRGGSAAAMAGDAALARQMLARVDAGQLDQAGRAALQMARLRASIAGLPPPEALAQIPPPAQNTPPEVATRVWKLRAELLFASGRPIQGVHALVQRGVWLLDPAAMRANQDLIWTRLRKVSEPGKRLTSVKEVGRVTRGWVQLATIADHSWTDRKALEDRLALWARRYPDHPASQHLLAQQFDYQPPASTGNYLANTGVIGLALPLSGRYRHAAAAIRDGFVAGYYALGSQQVSLRVYDASRFNSNAALLTQARKDGVGLLVGPLDKQRVAALTRAPAPQMAVLALNYSDTSQRFPGFFQFGLAPEDEARAVARRAIAQGWHRALALVPEGDWGGRVLRAFRDTLAAAGGRLVDYATYDPSLPDHAKPIQRLLQHYQPRSQTPDGKTVAFHTGVDFFFLAAEPGQARLIRSQLRFYRAGHLPLLATSDVYTGEPQPTKDDDLNGLVFADMPWLLGSNPDVRAMRKQLATVWGNDEQGFPRLFAMGLDAWRLAKHMRAGQLAPGRLFHGATGTLYLQPDGQIRRRLDFARFVQGAPKPLPEVETPMTPMRSQTRPARGDKPRSAPTDSYQVY